MKMVLARFSGKRNLRDQPLEENDAMKRTRVHAQRKFAQGVALSPVSINKDTIKLNGVPPSGDAASAKNSGNHSEISEVLPSKRPNTEDFLTFLCFRNTSILPARLDFFGAASGSSSSKSTGSSRKSNNKAAVSRSTTSGKSEESTSKLTNKGKAAASKLSVLKQKYRERELLRKKKMNAPKHAQRASAKRLQPLVDRRKQVKVSSVTKRSLRNEIKLKKLEAAKKKSVADKKVASKSKEIANKPSKEIKKPAPVESQAKNVKSTATQNALKSKAKRAPLNLRRGLRSGSSAVAQELNLKSKRLQIIRNRKAKLGADKKSSSPTEPVKTTKRISAPKAKNIGSDFSSEDDQPLIKKQKTKESNEKPAPSPKITDAPVSPRPARRTKETASFFLEILGKDSKSVKRSNDSQNLPEKSQADTLAAKRNDDKEKTNKGKPETKTQVKEETSKKEDSKVKNVPKGKLDKAKPKRAVIVKKKTVIANRTGKGKLSQARTRGHAVLPKLTLKQRKSVETRRPSSADKESEKPETETSPDSSPKDKLENAVSTRSGKISAQTNPSKKETVESGTLSKSKADKVSKEKPNSAGKSVPEKLKNSDAKLDQSVAEKSKNQGVAAVKSKKPSASLTQTDQSAVEKSKKPSTSLTQAEPSTVEKSKRSSASLDQKDSSAAEKSKKPSSLAQADVSTHEKSKKPSASSARTSSPAADRSKISSASPTRTSSPATDRSKKSSASPTRNDSSAVEKSKKPSLIQVDKPAAVEKPNKPSTQAGSSESVTRNTRRGSVPSISPPPQIPKNKNKPKDALSESSSKNAGLTGSPSAVKSETVKKSETPASAVEKKSENVTKTKNPVKSSASKNDDDALSSDKIVEKKTSESKSSSEQKEQKSTATRSRPLSDKRLSISSDEETLKLSVLKNISDKNSGKAKASKSKSDANKSVKTAKASAEPKAKKLKKAGTRNLSSVGSSESDGETSNVEKPTPKKQLEAKSLKKVSPKKSNKELDTSSSEDDKVEDDLNLAALKTNLSKKSNLSVSDREKNILKSTPAISKEKVPKSSLPDKKGLNKNLVSDQTQVDKNTSKVTNVFTALEKETPVKKVSNKHSSIENIPAASSRDNLTKIENESPSPARKNRSKVTKSNLSSLESLEKAESFKEQNLSNDKVKGQKIVIVAKLKEESAAKARKTPPAVSKELNQKVVDNSLNLLVNKTKPLDKVLFASDDSKQARSSELSAGVPNASRNIITALPKDGKVLENNLTNKQLSPKPANDASLPVKSLNVKSHGESSANAVMKPKDANPINLLDDKALHSKEIKPSYFNTSAEKKSNTLNPKELSSLERKDYNKAIGSAEQKSNTCSPKESSSLEQKDSVVSVEQKSKVFNPNAEKKNSNKMVSFSVSADKKSNAFSPKEPSSPEKKDSKKMVSTSVSAEKKSNLFNPKESKSLEWKDSTQVHSVSAEKDSNPFYPKVSNSLELKDPNKMVHASISAEKKSNITSPKNSLDKRDSDKMVYSFMEQKSGPSNAKESSNIARKEHNKMVSAGSSAQNSSNSYRFEPAPNSLNQPQSMISGSESSKIFNKFEASKKEVNVLATAAKSTSKDSSKSQKNVDQALSRMVPEPTQEDLVAASESLIKLSMSHVPFQSSLFGPSLKANNESQRSQSQINVPLQNFERTPMPLVKIINTNPSMISPEKDGKFDYLKKRDNMTSSSSKNHLEAPATSNKPALKVKSTSDKNLLGAVSSQFKNELSSPSNLKFSEAVSCSGNNALIQQNAGQPSPSVNSFKQNRNEPGMSNQIGSPVLATKNVNKLDGDGSGFSPNQRGNRLQSKKVENAEMESVHEGRKNKQTNQNRDMADHSDRSKSLNLSAEDSLSKLSVREKEVKNNTLDSKSDEKLGARARTRRQSMSKPSDTFNADEGVDKKRSKSSSAASGSASPPLQRRSTRIKEPSSPRRRGRSPSPPPQRVLRERKSTYFGEVDSSDEDEDFNFLIASGKLFGEPDVISSPQTRKDDKNVNKDAANDKKSDEKKLVLSKRNNVAESRSNVKASDSAEPRLPDGTPLKKIDNKNQDVDGSKSKLEQMPRGRLNSDSNKLQDVVVSKNTNLSSDRRNAPPNHIATSSETSDSRTKSNLLSATMTPAADCYLKNTNARRHETSANGSSKSSKSNLYQSEPCPLRTPNECTSQKLEASGANRVAQVSNVSDSKSINTQITNYLHFSPSKSANDQASKPKSIPNNSPSCSILRDLSKTPANSVPSGFTKETNALQANPSLTNSVKETNIHAKPNALVPNVPSAKVPEIPKLSNIDTSMLPNNPRTYFNRSLAAAHFKSHSAETSINKNLFAHASNEKQVNQLLKPMNKEINSAQSNVSTNTEPRTSPAAKPQNSNLDQGNDATVSSSSRESVPKKPSPSKEPAAPSSADLSASWKNAFKNVKLPKPFPSVPKTPMDRNAWIKKHSAPLKLNKYNEQAGHQSDPFIIKSKPNDIFSANAPHTSSFSFDHKSSNFDVKTVSSSQLSRTGARDLSPRSASPAKKIDNENQKSSEKNVKASNVNFHSSLATPLVKGSPSSESTSTKWAGNKEESCKDPSIPGKHLNLPICVEQTLKQNTFKSSPQSKKGSASRDKDASMPENLSVQPVTTSHKQFVENSLADKEYNATRKVSNVNLNQQNVSSTSPEKPSSKFSIDKPTSPSKFKNSKNPSLTENLIKPSLSSSHESPSKTPNNLIKSGIESSSKQPPKTGSNKKKSGGASSKSRSYEGIDVGAEFFPEPQSQKPSYSSNPTLKKYSQSLSTSTRKSIDSEVDTHVSEAPPTPEGTPEKSAKKVIFQQRRMSVAKDTDSPKKAVAFSPEHESSVYAFEPDLPPTSTPFRRNKSKSNQELNSNLDSSSASSNNSIAVQVNLETEAVFECSTQTDVEEEEENEGQLFYIPLQQSVSAPSPQIQGVAVKLGTEGPDQRVIMRAKLVTKPPSNYTKKTAAVATNTVSSLSPLQVVSPEKRKVRPLGASSVDSSAPVGTVQPTSRSTSRDSPSPLASPKSTESTSFDLSMPSTSSANRSPKVVKRGKKSAPQTSSASNTFPKPGSPAQIVEAPTFYPTEEEFSDPLEYIEQIKPMAEQFGLCRIVPPSNFKPECKVSDDMRFTAYNQFVHRMLHRWGPSSKESAAIRKHLATENITLKNPPCIGGVELDLPQLYHKVQVCGGLRKVMEQDRWQRVADLMKIPKSVHDRSSKLDEIYCKYLLPYDTLSTGERAKLFADVEKEWKHHKLSENELFEDIDDCIIKGRSMALNQFYRVARNIMTIHFGAAAADKEIGPDPEDVESEYWEHVSSGQNHICVHSASIDTGPRGYGFPTVKNSTFAKHNWNLKILTNNSGSVLRSLGPIIGVTVPTLHVQMLFTTCCWYRDPHGLPWIEYLHTGASKIWYGIPAEYNSVFRSAMSKLLPSHKRSDQSVWLASDTAMVPPPLLVENGVSLSRIVQQPGQFIVVFPRAFTSSIATGYLLSESVYFAPSSWLQSANEIFLDLQNSCESSIFSLEQLLCSIATDSRTSLEILTQAAPLVSEMRDREVALRSQLEDLGLRATERLPRNNKRKSQVDEEEDYECETCHASLYISLVSNSFEEVNYCLCHGIELLSKKRNHLKYCKLQYAYTEEELEEMIVKLNERIEQKSQKKPSSRGSGSTPTK